jgi:hypothetical protein
MFGWGQKRTAESKTEKYEIQNGKELSERYMSSFDFVTKVLAQKNQGMQII